MSYDTLSAVESNVAPICGEMHFVICLQMRKQLRLITYILFAQCHGTRDPSHATTLRFFPGQGIRDRGR